MEKNSISKARVVTIIGVIILLLGIGGLCAQTFTITQTTVAVQAEENDVIPESYEFVDGITISNGADDYYLSLCNASLQALPAWFFDQFQASGWSIVVTSEDINEVYLDNRYSIGEGNVNGATVYSMERIVIADSIQAASTAALHEMGHWCDYVTADDGMSFSSDSGEFITIYEKEADAFIVAFGIDNPDTDSRQELCADLFKYYWKEPEKLGRKCPGLYGWMENLVAKVETIEFT